MTWLPIMFRIYVVCSDWILNIECCRIPLNIEAKHNDLVDTGRKLNVHKTFSRRLGRLLNVLRTFNLRPVSTGKTVVNGNMKYDEALCLGKINAESDDGMIWRSASKLRTDIFVVQSKEICELVTVDNIMEGEAIPPDSIKSFFKMFSTGNLYTTEEPSSKKSRLFDSNAAEAIFFC